eukprot:Pgem_evm1s337
MQSNNNDIIPNLNGDDTALYSAVNAVKEQSTTTTTTTTTATATNEFRAYTYTPGTEPNFLGAGDSTIHHDFITNAEKLNFFSTLQGIGGEIEYEQWYHMPSNKTKALRALSRVKVAQANLLPNGNQPYYRFPVNNQSRYPVKPFSPTVQKVINKVNAFFEGKYNFNHAVVLLYRNGTDRIGFHKDKTLDLDSKAPIVSLSLGSTRTYILQDHPYTPTKRQTVTLKPGTLMVLGPKSNQEYYHSVIEEPGLHAERVSITLRVVTTFVNVDKNNNVNTLLGQGNQYQTLDWPTELKGKHRLEDYQDQTFN